MPFIPHTDADVAVMLSVIGVDDIESLFDEIPAPLRSGELTAVDAGLSEMDVLRRLAARARQDEAGPCFLGAGSYDHHIPAAVWDIAGRGEFMTAYTPYQAEASQGTLQLIYEFQTMMAELTGMDVCNASVYDGGSGLAEAVLMAVRANRRAATGRDGLRTVAIAGNVHPLYLATTRTIVRNQGIEIVTLPYGEDGRVDPGALQSLSTRPVAVVVQQPNFFGLLDNVDALTDQARALGARVVACVNPVSLALLKPPGAWGETGADIVCGDGQPLGVPMASGGPSFGFICARQAFVRQLPGRIVGRTEDAEGRPGFTLTLQAREQHIRRAKATSKHLHEPGAAGDRGNHLHEPPGGRSDCATSRRPATPVRASWWKSSAYRDGSRDPSSTSVSWTSAARRPRSWRRWRGAVWWGDSRLGPWFPELDHGLLVCATERRTGEEMREFAHTLAGILED